MLEVLFAIQINLSSLSFRDEEKIKMIKKYFKEEKAQKGEVINTKSGHQIRASVKISLVTLNPVFFYFSHHTICSTSQYGEGVYAFWSFLICINFHDPLSQLTALTEHRLRTMDQLGWRGKKNLNHFVRLDWHTDSRHSDGSGLLNTFISRDQICNDTSWLNCAPVSMSTLLGSQALTYVPQKSARALVESAWGWFWGSYYVDSAWGQYIVILKVLLTRFRFRALI